MNNKISVIIPIYNSEKTLVYCLDSIINQTYKDLEIILINDGSKDNSEKICKEYKNKDKRIKYIKKTNSGVADTRNKGIDEATGKYLMFIDSDDYITKDYINSLYTKMINDNVDIVVSSMIIREKNKDTYVSLGKELSNVKIDDIIDEVINTVNFSSSCKTLFKKDIISSIRFNKNLKYGEDMLFEYSVLKRGTISYIDNPGYIYIQNNESVSHCNDTLSVEKYLLDTMYVLDNIKNDYPNKIDVINNRKLSKINLALIKLSINKKIRYKEYKKLIIDYIKNCSIKTVNLKKLSNENISNKVRMFLLKNKVYYMYYSLNKLINIIKKR